MSAAPSVANASSDTMNDSLTPNVIVATPNTATPPNIQRPTLRVIGFTASHIAQTAAPTPGAVRSTPSPVGPTCNTSRANTGSKAVAPPNNTANRSSEIAPRTIGFDHTNRSPDNSVARLAGSR